MNKENNIRRDMYGILKICNETAAICRSEDPDKLECRVRERLRDTSIINIPIDAAGIEKTPLEDRILMAMVCLDDMLRSMKRYGRSLILAEKLKCGILCNPDKKNGEELDKNLKVLKEVSEGRSSEQKMDELAGYLTGLGGMKLDCLAGILAGVLMHVNVLFGIILLLKWAGLF